VVGAGPPPKLIIRLQRKAKKKAVNLRILALSTRCFVANASNATLLCTWRSFTTRCKGRGKAASVGISRASSQSSQC
jgi:hypothetical protein